MRPWRCRGRQDMAEKLFSFRWDIDHRACMTDGVPVIRSVCREYGVANTFFVNMGRSTNLREWLGKGLRGSKAKFSDMESINLVRKIGWRRFLTETMLARPVGRSFIPELEALKGDGHELGLHGGSDHVVWSRRFRELPDAVIEADVSETLADFEARFGRPAGFTSPGFKSDDRVVDLVDRLGFLYNGDAIGGSPHVSRATSPGRNHWTVPVTICGPRTIPYFEYHAALGRSHDAALAGLETELADARVAVLYGHPCHEGLDRQQLGHIFDLVLRKGFRFVTHEELVGTLNRDSAPGHAV